MSISAELEKAIDVFAGRASILVALDFDGPLAPIVSQPGQARAIPEALAAIGRLNGQPGVRVAIVSGRSLGNLDEVGQMPAGVLLVGSHGVEARLDEGGDDFALTDTEQRAMDAILAGMRAVEKAWPGTRIETKPAGYTLHHRGLDEATQEGSTADIVSRVEALPEELRATVTFRRGKAVEEFSVRNATKGDAINRLREYTGADAVFYTGDDVTDEDAFAVLKSGDVSVKVGDGETRAEFRVEGAPEVAEILNRIAEHRPVAA